MFRFAALLLVILCPPAFGQSETAYVTDMLRLGLHRAQDTSDRAFRTLVSGAELTVLERVTNYARVRTADGAEGWVKSAFLVTEKPAQLRVAEMEAELERARAGVAKAEAARQRAEKAHAALEARVESRVASAEADLERLEHLERENAAYERRLEAYRHSLPWSWAAAAIGVALVGGFLLGLWWLDAAIRRRYGGFRLW